MSLSDLSAKFFSHCRQIRSGLCWKIAFAFALTFLITVGLSFFIIYTCHSRVLYQSLHTHLLRASDGLDVEYLRGYPLWGRERVIPLSSVPMEDLDKVRQLHPEFQPRLAVKMEHITLLGTVAGEPAHITISGDTLSRLKIVKRKEIRTDEFYEDVSDDRTYPFIFILISPEGKPVAHTPLPERVLQAFLTEELLNPTPDTGSLRTHVHLRRRDIIVHKRKLVDGTVLLVGLGNYEIERSLRQLQLLFILALIVAPLFGGIAGWYIGSRISRGLRRVTASACRIKESRDYSARVEHGSGGRELNELIDSYNAMVENTGKILAELRTITDNVAHDLRTPLTRLRGKAELAIFENAENELASDVAEECSNMLEMINTALELAQTESGADMKLRECVDLNELVENLADLYSVAAEDAAIRLECRLPEKHCTLYGSKNRLQRLLANLLDNALKYTPEDGLVTVSLIQSGREILLEVEDTGHGIAPDDLPHIYDRFYRADSSRSLPGNGLGLCLVRAIAENHGGTVSVRSKIGQGTAFTVHFPL